MTFMFPFIEFAANVNACYRAKARLRPVERRGSITESGAGQLVTGGTSMLDGRRQLSTGGTSRITRERPVWFCEELGGEIPWAYSATASGRAVEPSSV